MPSCGLRTACPAPPSRSILEERTFGRAKSALRSFFAFCLESGWIKDNPARLSRSSPLAAKEPTTLTDDEIGLLRGTLAEAEGCCTARDRLTFEILLGTGIRLGSLVGLSVGDVDLGAGVLHIRAKGGTRERVFLNPVLVRMLGRYLRNVAREAYTGLDPSASLGTFGVPLFRSQSGRRLGARQVQLRFSALCQAAGLTRRVSVHSLRHAFATRLYRKTGDLYLVQRALGHRQIATTEIYARVSDEALRRAAGAES